MRVYLRSIAAVGLGGALLATAACSNTLGPRTGQNASKVCEGPCDCLCRSDVVRRLYFPNGIPGHNPAVKQDMLSQAKPMGLPAAPPMQYVEPMSPIVPDVIQEALMPAEVLPPTEVAPAEVVPTEDPAVEDTPPAESK